MFGSIEKEIKEDFDELVMQVVSPDVVIQKSADDICRIQYQDCKEDPVFAIKTENHTLRFSQIEEWDRDDWKHPERLIERLGNLWDQTGLESSTVIIQLPEKEWRRIETETVSGDIQITDMENAADLLASSVSGTISIQNTENDKALNVSTISGGIRIENAALYSGTMESVSGDVELDSSSASR